MEDIYKQASDEELKEIYEDIEANYWINQEKNDELQFN